MGAGMLAVKRGFILFIKHYQFSLQINTLERELCPLTVTPLTCFPKGMLPTGLSGSWPYLILVADDLANFDG
jgi:hypothetical protein